MAYAVIVKEVAFYEALEAYFYYEEKEVGLGERFLNMLDLCYKRLAQNPQHYSFVFPDKERTMRDVKIKGFPYIVIYDFTGNEVTVFSVHNTYKKKQDYFG